MDDISFLVNETFKTVEKSEQADSYRFPETGGILYTIAQNTSTFIIRGRASRNLKKDFLRISEANKDIDLRLEADEINNVFFFETPFWELSEMITEMVTQKRFLKVGDRLSNLSDPHLIWSFGIKEDDQIGRELVIDCSSRYAHKKDFHKIGYLGESSIALERFSQLLGEKFKDVVKLRENDSSELFHKLNKLFSFQEFDSIWFEQYFSRKFSSSRAEAFELYFQELHTLMLFWKQINEQLSAAQSPV